MFTGIIDHQGKIVKIDQSPQSSRFAIQTKFQDIVEGESIAVNGVCLTAIKPEAGLFYCDVSPETLKLSNLKIVTLNSSVNLERAMRLSDRFGGHWVSGHVDQTCKVSLIKQCEQYYEYHFEGIPAAAKKYFIKKGSVTINGVSLTINEVNEHGFQVMLIPHTLEITNLSALKVEDEVNIEYDCLVKIVAAQLADRVGHVNQ